MDETVAVVYSKALPDLIGFILSVITKMHKEDEEAGHLEELKNIRSRLLSVLDSFKTKFKKTDPEIYYDVIEIFLASILANLSHNIKKVM